MNQNSRHRFSMSALQYTLSGTTADSINTIRLCKATDATCTTCNTNYTIITSNTPIPYATSGTTYNISAASIASYLASQSFGNGNYYIGMYVQSSTANCSGNYCSANKDSAGNFLCMQANYNTVNGVTSLTQSDNGIVQVNIPAAYPGIYVETNNNLVTYSPNNGTTVYVGTTNSYVLYTSNLGSTWSEARLSSGDTSGITALFVGQTASLSSLFIESYGIIPITNSAVTSTITVSNLSNTTATNVHVNSNQLPTNVTQTSPSCSSVAPGASCNITLTANGTKAFAPTAFNIIDNDNVAITRSALISSITPNSGTNYYYVYGVSGTAAYVVDNIDTSTAIIWSSDNAEGLCYQSTNGGALAGAWYLPATCELNGGIYLNTTTNQFANCSPIATSIFSLHSLGALGGALSTLTSTHLYWSSTEVSGFGGPKQLAWAQAFFTGGGGSPYVNFKYETIGVRCSQALSI
jgi:hypothetical protein